ncbi:MAG: hypothetical protein ABS85_09770 [Sphingobacteriales bacterium SCN 48-20]|jgi:magnesium-transporting ATPase (P-type)|uniref:hypothetical protein n=1 Tax=Terrimonas ferruginea TaxID=249 RepID=UPI00086BC795|nr:hypothetical protein [Terrimonas ferruginea]MBN8782049.1 hypothetical protein [Terrimonas ferruginea]ODT92388.1 MAG: hypothetical protein ABS85_09770 [Sphingobacteriales bacterium SCN 48-20]OJW45178.1 MAG: hypothetical protein BGO56_17255 [Sphingobacteriales bacterium 48-107]
MNSIFDISDKPLDDKVRLSLRSFAVVAGTAAVVMGINVLFSLIASFVTYGKAAELKREMEGFSANTFRVPEPSMGGLILQTVITLAIWGVLIYFLSGFARKTKQGIDSNNQALITTGLGNLASYFKIIGVLLCIFVGFMLLALLVAL